MAALSFLLDAPSLSPALALALPMDHHCHRRRGCGKHCGGWLFNDDDDRFFEDMLAFGPLRRQQRHQLEKKSLTEALAQALATSSSSLGNRLGAAQVKVNEVDGSTTFRIELPGVKKENTNVTIVPSDDVAKHGTKILTVKATIDDEALSHHDNDEEDLDNKKANDNGHDDDDDVFAQAAKAASAPPENEDDGDKTKQPEEGEEEDHQQQPQPMKKRARQQQQLRKASVSRSWTLPANVDVSLIKAEQADGVLMVTIPKPIEAAKPEPIRIGIV